MATVVKDFKVKAGLIVEGTTAKVNNFDILTKKEADQNFIIDLIGGETLVKSVSNEFDVSVGGELSLDRVVVDTFYDAAGSADTAEDNAIAHTNARETAITTAYQSYADTAEADAITSANSYTAGRETAITTAYQTYADTAEADAISTASADATTKANAAQAAAEATASADATTKANAAQAAAEATASADATTKANAAQSAAEATASADATAKANAAQAAAESFATTAVANLVDGAPAVLDTLNELAEALQDNPDIISDLQTVAAGKQNTLTPGANIDITSDTISVTGLDSGDISDFDSAAILATAASYDVLGAAASAQTAAEATASADATSKANAAQSAAEATASADATTKANAAQAAAEATASTDATTKANNAEANAIAHADALTTDEIEEGVNNEYFTDVRAKNAAAALLTSANLDNITITGTGAGLTITAENGVADSDTDDLAEGTTNLYFLDSRAVDALEAVVPNFTEVDLNSVATQVAATSTVATASQAVAYSFDGGAYKSAKFLVKVAYGTHTEVSEVLLTLDTADNIAITEYAVIGTNGSASTISAGMDGTDVQLLVTTVNNNSTVTVMGTLLV